MTTAKVRDLLKSWAVIPDLSLTDNNTSLSVRYSGDDIRRLFTRFSEREYVYEEDDKSAVLHFSGDWQFFVDIHQHTFDSIFTALMTEYKPLENYSMTEDGTDTTAGSDTTTRTGSDTTTNGGTVMTADTTTTTTTNKGTVKDESGGTATNAVAGYDSSTMSDRDKTTTSDTNTRTDDTTQTATNSGAITRTDDLTSTILHNTTDATATSSNITHKLTRSGNIGVTTSQQMLASEIDIRVKHNVLYYIIEMFISQYTVWR